MRAILSDYQMIRAKDLRHALTHLRENPAHSPFAGGTDLMVQFEAGRLPPGTYLDLSLLHELRGIEVSQDAITLGALTSYSDIHSHPILKTEFPHLVKAARLTGAIAIQNRGTLGGNIVNASPAADSPPALLVSQAEIECLSDQGSRWLPYCDFHLAYKKTQLQTGEILSRVRLPRPQHPRKYYYRKIGTRNAQAISKVCLAVAADWQGDSLKYLAIALGSVAPIPMLCQKTAEFLKNHSKKGALPRSVLEKAKDILASEISPISDIRSTDHYRLIVSQNLIEEAWESIQ